MCVEGRAGADRPAGVFEGDRDILRLERDQRFLLRKYGARACLVRNSKGLGTYLEVRPGWQGIDQGKPASVFVFEEGARGRGPVSRRGSPNQFGGGRPRVTER